MGQITRVYGDVVPTADPNAIRINTPYGGGDAGNYEYVMPTLILTYNNASGPSNVAIDYGSLQDGTNVVNNRIIIQYLYLSVNSSNF